MRQQGVRYRRIWLRRVFARQKASPKGPHGSRHSPQPQRPIQGAPSQHLTQRRPQIGFVSGRYLPAGGFPATDSGLRLCLPCRHSAAPHTRIAGSLLFIIWDFLASFIPFHGLIDLEEAAVQEQDGRVGWCGEDDREILRGIGNRAAADLHRLRRVGVADERRRHWFQGFHGRDLLDSSQSFLSFFQPYL